MGDTCKVTKEKIDILGSIFKVSMVKATKDKEKRQLTRKKHAKYTTKKGNYVVHAKNFYKL